MTPTLKLLAAIGLAIGVLAAGSALAQRPVEKPRVPPGRDPGGIAIAIIGAGADYTRPEIAARLARDGEGEIIGWDFIDNDRRPYAPCTDERRRPYCPETPTSPLYVFPGSRLVLMRATLDAPQSLVQAVQTAALTPARIVLVALDPPPPLQFVVDAAARYPQLVFVATTRSPEQQPREPVHRSENVFALAADASDEQQMTNARDLTAVIALTAAACIARQQDATPARIMSCVDASAASGADRR